MAIAIDTDICRDWASKIGEVMSIYQSVADGAHSIGMNDYADLASSGDDPGAGESVMALETQVYVWHIQYNLGTERLKRIKTHFLEVADKVERIEGKLMSKGEHLFDL